MSSVVETRAESRTITIALLGNPNTGKSTLFNALADVRQHVGNYPGVTVEKKIGHVLLDGQRFALVDLPGTYSLAPRSPDEMVTVDVLLGRQTDVTAPDVILCVVDASKLERNLYLVSQAIELGVPTVVVLNKMDVAAEHGIELDIALLQKRLGVPVIPLQADRRIGLESLKQELPQVVGQTSTPSELPFPDAFRQEVLRLQNDLQDASSQAGSGATLPRYLVERLLLDQGGYVEQADLPGVTSELLERVSEARARLADAGFPVPAVEAKTRYQWVARMLDGAVVNRSEDRITLTDRLDQWLMHRVWGTALFIAVMVVVFQSIFMWAIPLMDLIEEVIAWLSESISAVMAEGALRSLLADGVLAGVGSVLVFLPQILILFFFIALLEECGYMARAAYLMDRLMYRVGLSGKSFIPLLSSFACAVPGIMATRVIEDRRDRLVTILVAPLMTCSARLPVYTLLIAAFIPDQRWLGGWLGLQGITMLAMYLLGMATAVLAAWLFKRTLLRGQTPSFIMELPHYRLPSLQTVVRRMLENGWAFVSGAGTLILVVAILVWAAAYFPHPPEIGSQVRAGYTEQLAALEQRERGLQDRDDLSEDQRQAALDQLLEERGELRAEISSAVAAAYMEQSFLARAGHFIEPVVRPLGWDWRIGCAVIASFPAREVVVGTLGVIYHLGEGEDETSESLRETLRSATWPGTGRKVFNVPVALSLMVFFALCAQCAPTLVIIRRETNSWAWPIFTFVYMTLLAYIGALITYQTGMLLVGS
ncbi:MAG: ferrous iron transport protein B [Planctomycetaceae bacterium]|nr:MAG: ferrous iron transport protein B [Planctomycetaceae bacterium]